MSVEDLARLVQQMRAHQKTYFASNGKAEASLRAAKDYERRVDAAVKEILHPTRTLFDDGEKP